jgi:two-component system LytT family sensor kinase
MTVRRASWLAAAIFWTLFGVITGVQVWVSMIAHGHSLVRMIAYYLLVWDAWLICTAVVVLLVRTRPLIPPTARNFVVHLFGALVVAVGHITWWMGLTFLIRPYDAMTVPWADFPVGELFFARLPLELILYAGVAASAHAIEYFIRARDLELSLANARLHALELQIQPHFLFNTLNAISTLVRTERNREAVTMIAGLSEMFRYMLDHSEQQLVALEEESAMVGRYFEIQRMRFPDRFTFDIDVAADVRHAAVPTFILQPLAENAIRHGIAQSSGSGTVSVRAFRDKDDVRIEMFNSGRLAEVSSGGIGLRNTRERLRQLFGDTQRFSLTTAAGGVLAALTIPWEEARARGHR